eukprot:CAMPEP_0113702606 /NCGR_PEP_ID=MMETSP0038_2-20120614/25305_1 /TAXON_ID=2898 /ORGANISM="Cryptomonas paramecium" /LENGTH=94 /DNA_ID=CAMNT_0000626791 /DNA_START=55 /DNA_END=339 /DNA_ORIENTATION=- /assembly_acc=CAM_ASM_000170
MQAATDFVEETFERTCSTPPTRKMYDNEMPVPNAPKREVMCARPALDPFSPFAFDASEGTSPLLSRRKLKFGLGSGSELMFSSEDLKHQRLTCG